MARLHDAIKNMGPHGTAPLAPDTTRDDVEQMIRAYCAANIEPKVADAVTTAHTAMGTVSKAMRLDTEVYALKKQVDDLQKRLNELLNPSEAKGDDDDTNITPADTYHATD